MASDVQINGKTAMQLFGGIMDITIDLETCTLMIHLQPDLSYAIFIRKLDGWTTRMTIEQLILALDSVAGKNG